ncbi:hypothetical protein ACSMX9_15520 [Streptomyces sp. LE64]|uniref:hypothetical protein n=1 Tax=Streptomyces sp. LE64 TaxID=3448653 RepID=UPI004042BAFC
MGTGEWSPGAVAAAFGVWSVRVHGDRRRLRPWEAEHSCVCCGRGWARDQLERAVAMLPARAASELRAAVAELDAVLLRRTHHDPQSSEELAWWHRRC